MKRFKVLSVFLSMILVICGLSLRSYADNNKLLKVNDEYDFGIELISVEKSTEEEKEEIKGLSGLVEEKTRGLSRPSQVWNVGTEGRCSFSGEASRSNLYSEYVFTGKSKYTYSVRNWHDEELTIKIKKDNLLGSTIETIIIPGNTRKTYTITTSDDFYFVYYAPVDATGYIE